MANLYDKASLVQIPSGYKDGKLYNIKPFDQPFEFERGSAATRVNENGLIENSPTNGVELVTDGDFSSDSSWNLSGAVIENGVLKLKATSGTVRCRQQIGFVGLVRISYTVVLNDTPSETFQIREYSGAGAESYPATVGEHVVYKNLTTQGISFQTGAYGGEGLHISNLSVQEVNLDTPILDYSGSEPSLLLDRRRRNVLPYSEDFTQWDTTGAATILTSGFSSPNNGIDAYHIAAGVSGSSVPNSIYDFPQVTIPPSTTYTFSVFAKKGEYKNIFLRAGARDGASITFDLDTFEFIQKYEGVAPITDYSITQMRDGWAKICFSYTTADTSPNFVPNIMFYPDSGVTINTTGCSFAGDGVSGGYIYGAQLEDNGSLGAASYPTSYIPTNGQVETRLYDDMNFDLSNVLGTGDATFIFDFDFDTLRESSAYLYRIYSGTDNFGLKVASTTNRTFQLRAITGFTNHINIIESADETSHKVAVRITGSVVEVFYNGTKMTSTMTGLSSYSWDLYKISADNSFVGKTKQLLVFPEALTDTELQQLTTI